MEETLGKRIVANRKRLGLTQDALAEQLGVTAQAVSKWENDQSCPDITMLPKLAEIFSITIDELLGRKKQDVREAEVIQEEKDAQATEGLHFENGVWELQWDGGRKTALGFAVWVLLVGGILLASNFCRLYFTLWELLWPSALLIFGLFGLYPRFSTVRLGCAFFGGYFLMEHLGLLHLNWGMNLILPLCLLLFGLSLLIDALCKPRKPHFHISHNGKPISGKHGKFCSECTTEGEHFDCSLSFGEDHRLISLPRLSSGDISTAFGALSVDLSACREIAPGCMLDASCCFGELTLLVPRKWRIEPDTSTAFGTVDIIGNPVPETEAEIRLDCSASFGHIAIRYI